MPHWSLLSPQKWSVPPFQDFRTDPLFLSTFGTIAGLYIRVWKQVDNIFLCNTTQWHVQSRKHVKYHHGFLSHFNAMGGSFVKVMQWGRGGLVIYTPRRAKAKVFNHLTTDSELYYQLVPWQPFKSKAFQCESPPRRHAKWTSAYSPHSFMHLV